MMYPIITPQKTKYPGTIIDLTIAYVWVHRINSPLRKMIPTQIVAKKKKPFITSKNVYIAIQQGKINTVILVRYQ